MKGVVSKETVVLRVGGEVVYKNLVLSSSL